MDTDPTEARGDRVSSVKRFGVETSRTVAEWDKNYYKDLYILLYLIASKV